MIDSIPTKIYDALGAGCPILLLAKGDSCKIIDEVNFGEHTSDEKELYNKFESMINNYESYESKKEKIAELVKKKYSRKMIAKKLEREVLEDGKQN